MKQGYILCVVLVGILRSALLQTKALTFSSRIRVPQRTCVYSKRIKSCERYDDIMNYEPQAHDALASNNIKSMKSRRQAVMHGLVLSSSLSTSLFLPTNSNAFENPLTPLDRRTNGVYQQAKRATTYFVDSTIPPTLVPFTGVSKERSILRKLGLGKGTMKAPLIDEGLTLNNMMNKGVFGAADLIQNTFSSPEDDRTTASGSAGKKAYDASFIFFGMNYSDMTGKDVNLAITLFAEILKPREKATAFALSFAPLSTQSALDDFMQNLIDIESLQRVMAGANVPKSSFEQQLPIIQFIKKQSVSKTRTLRLLACAPEYSDIKTARKTGLQNLDPEQRSKYVVDPEGFIGWTQEPKNKLYVERVLLKDWTPSDENDTQSGYFAERILIDETMATVMTNYAVSHPYSLVVASCNLNNIRFLGGPNGRIPRIFQYLKEKSNVDDSAITTILLNPTAEGTLSKSKFLRLEIGTSPNNIEQQTKVADYLWFSDVPKVNMLPRLMNSY